MSEGHTPTPVSPISIKEIEKILTRELSIKSNDEYAELMASLKPHGRLRIACSKCGADTAMRRLICWRPSNSVARLLWNRSPKT